MTNNEELKPCPFCKVKKWQHVVVAPFLTIIAKLLKRYKQVQCRWCGCLGPVEESEEEAINAWNKRVEQCK